MGQTRFFRNQCPPIWFPTSPGHTTHLFILSVQHAVLVAAFPPSVLSLATAATMAPQFPSIQSFFKSSKPSTSQAHAQPAAPTQAHSKEPGDGFTKAEVDTVLHPVINESWIPAQEYEKLEIANLVPGPKCVSFQGRVTNFYDQNTLSKRPRAAKGCIKVIVKDDSGALTVSSSPSFLPS
jgi:hypothetical protein